MERKELRHCSKGIESTSSFGEAGFSRGSSERPTSLFSTERADSNRANWVRDHLWPEIHHMPEQRVPRLRGEEGKSIGQRGRASNGIPWRQIPAYSATGAMAETGDPHRDLEEIGTGFAVVLPNGRQDLERVGKTSRTSYALSRSQSMKEALTTANERYTSAQREPSILKGRVKSEEWSLEPAGVKEARAAWLEAVKQRACTASREETHPHYTASLHWREKAHKKVSQECDTKASCPYSWDAAATTGTWATTSKRSHHVEVATVQRSSSRRPTAPQKQRKKAWK